MNEEFIVEALELESQYDNNHRELSKKLYKELMIKNVRFARYQSKARHLTQQYSKHHMIVYATKTSEIGRELYGINKKLFDQIIEYADSYLRALGDKDSDEYNEYVKNKNKKTNLKHNPKNNELKKLKKIENGSYMTKAEAQLLSAKVKVNKNYNLVSEAIKACELTQIKPTIKKLIEITGLSKPTIVKYKKKYLEDN